MTKLFLFTFIVTFVFFGCNNQQTKDKSNVTATVINEDTTQYSGLQGTWVRQSKEGFTLIEIKDTSNVLYYQFLDRKAEMGTAATDRYWYYKSKATMGYWNTFDSPYKADVDIWISTDDFRFDYKLKGDTLIEFDKMGDQGKFVKIYNDNQ